MRQPMMKPSCTPLPTLPYALMLLTVAAAAWPTTAHAGGPYAARTERFTAPGAVTSVVVANVNGEVSVTAGATFGATVELSVRAQDQATADAALARTKVVFAFDKGKVTLRTEDPEKSERGRDRARVDARYAVTVPAAAGVKVNAVNGAVRLEGLAGAVDADTVNGAVTVTGAVAGQVEIQSVNGAVEATFTRLPPTAKVNARTVNGAVTLWVPGDAAFKLGASFINGDLVSNLALPVQASGGMFGPPPAYQGAVGTGAQADVKMNSVNGRLAVFRAGSNGAESHSLMKRGPWLTGGRGRPGWGDAPPVPPVPAVAAMPPVPPAPPAPPGSFRWTGGDDEGRDIRLDAVAGDFVIERSNADVRVESIAGLARVRTASGDVRLGSVAKNADIHSGGGDIRVKMVGGTLEARTGGGDLRVDQVKGNARLETQGGDIELRGAGGGVVALTRGGDISLRGLRAGAKAETAGGDILLETEAPDPATGIDVSTSGGDVTLVLPANFRAEVFIETRVSDRDREDASDYIQSDFPELAVTNAGGLFSAKGKLGGGGPKLTVKARSGTVRVKKGPKI